MNKALIIYYSQYRHNTEKIARLFAEKIDCEIINIKELKNPNYIHVEKYDLIGFGSGVYKESVSPKLINLVEQLNLKGKSVFIFSTSGSGMKFYNYSLIRKLKAKGAVITGSFSCKGSFTAREFTSNKIFDFMGRLSEGHPNDKDLKRAEKFIEKTVKKSFCK